MFVCTLWRQDTGTVFSDMMGNKWERNVVFMVCFVKCKEFMIVYKVIAVCCSTEKSSHGVQYMFYKVKWCFACSCMACKVR